MGILSGPAIREAFNNGDIHINPWMPENVGPNSYDLRLASTLMIYSAPSSFVPLDVRKANATKSFEISEIGHVLTPGVLYLASTMEEAGSDMFVPCIEGRSSMARLGISPHVSAGFGDHGFKARWTLEITVTHPVRVYAGMRICQVFFHDLSGERQPYQGKYLNSTGVEPSRSFEDVEHLNER